jgi:hypothetical protein
MAALHAAPAASGHTRRRTQREVHEPSSRERPRRRRTWRGCNGRAAARGRAVGGAAAIRPETPARGGACSSAAASGPLCSVPDAGRRLLIQRDAAVLPLQVRPRARRSGAWRRTRGNRARGVAGGGGWRAAGVLGPRRGASGGVEQRRAAGVRRAEDQDTAPCRFTLNTHNTSAHSREHHRQGPPSRTQHAVKRTPGHAALPAAPAAVLGATWLPPSCLLTPTQGRQHVSSPR